MKIRNLSARAIILEDTPGQRYNIPAYSDLDANSALWSDTTFRRNLKYRSRDVVINDDTATAISTTVVAGNSTTVPLSTQGASGQTADLIDFKDSLGNILARVSNIGGIFGSQVGATGVSVGLVPLFGQAASGQTANIFEVRNQAATALVSVTPTGTLQFLSDTTISRLSAGVIGTAAITLTGALTTQNTQVGQIVIGSSSGTANIAFGTAADVNLSRVSSGTARLDSILQLLQATAGNVVLGTIAAGGDANYTFSIKRDGTHSWGPGGASAVDTTLNRSGVNTLTTGLLTLTGKLTVAAAGIQFNDGTTQTTATSTPAAGRQLLFGFA